MDVLKIFGEIIGIGMLLGAVVVVSCECDESERHRLMARAAHSADHEHLLERQRRPRA